jgi:hypothetical protein
MNNSKHTPTPWQVRPYDLKRLPQATVAEDGSAWAGQNWDLIPSDGSERAACTVSFRSVDCAWSPTQNKNEAVANRDFILSAVNSHDSMVELARSVVHAVKHLEVGEHDLNRFWDLAMKALKEAGADPFPFNSKPHYGSTLVETNDPALQAVESPAIAPEIASTIDFP